MIFTKVRKAVAIVLLFALLFSTFPMSALANDTDDPKETVVTDETATVETTTEPVSVQPETSPDGTELPDDTIFDPVMALGPAAVFKGNYAGYMRKSAKVFFLDGSVDSIKRMVLNDGQVKRVYCLQRTLDSAQGMDYSISDNWGLGSYASDKKQAIGKILTIAYNLDPNVNFYYGEDRTIENAKSMVKEVAVQLLVWEITEKNTSGPYTLNNQYRYKLNDSSRGLNYLAYPNWDKADLLHLAVTAGGAVVPRLLEADAAQLAAEV